MMVSRTRFPIFIALTIIVASYVPTVISSDADAGVKIQVYEGPTDCSSSTTGNNAAPTRIERDYIVALHFTVSIDPSSKTGTPNKKVESSLDREIPVAPSFPVGQGRVIPGLDEGLIGLCKGSKAYIIIPPHLAYGNEGVPENNVPGSATLRYDVEIIDINLPSPNEFSKIDANKDWRLSRDEVKQYFSEMDKMIDLDGLYEAEDKDRDGYISWEEFTGPKGDMPPPKHQMHRQNTKTNPTDGEPDKKKNQDTSASSSSSTSSSSSNNQDGVLELFELMDTDKNGMISKDEMRALFISMGGELAEEFWLESDADGDGYVSLAEFIGSENSEKETDGKVNVGEL